MKKHITIVALMLLAIAASAQEHITFRDIALGGPAKSVASALTKKGYTQKQMLDENTYWLGGTFAGYDAEVLVLGTAKTQTAWKVSVVLPETDSWSSARNQYESLKENLQAKYGKPSSYEFFKSPYRLGDGYETTAFFADKATWVSFYSVTADGNKIGSISLRIEKFGTGVAVRIDYEDELTTSIWESEKKSVIYEDL